MALESFLPNNATIVKIVVEICSSTVSDLNLIGVFFMWFLMSIAMMSPTIIPTLNTYNDILESGGKKENSFWLFFAGFLSVWMIFSILMSLIQVFLGRLYLLNDQGAFVSSLLSSAFLLLAGLYQLSSYKEACLIRCQTPFTFFLQNWKRGKLDPSTWGYRLGYFVWGAAGLSWHLLLLGAL